MRRLYPPVTSRKASEHFDEMTAVASVSLPEWSGLQTAGEFGFALMKVLAMLAERSTTAIEKTSLRDSVAFFNYLDVPAESSRPAMTAVTFRLNEKHADDVDAPSGVQIGAPTDGDEQIFETTSGLRILRARLDYLAAVDTDSDRIEIAPLNFLAFEPEPPGPESFTVPTEIPENRRELQVEPPEGLGEGDYVRFSGDAEHAAVYRLGEGKDGVFELLDPLEADVRAGARLEKVTDFAAFETRNVQAHEAYIGHKDLLNLEQPAQISVHFEPAVVADQLSNEAQWYLYGPRLDDNGDEKIDWHQVSAAAAVDGEIVLTKSWSGGVDETEVDGSKNRWLKLRWRAQITTHDLTAPVRTIRIGVESLDAGQKDSDVAERDDACCKTAGNTVEPDSNGVQADESADTSVSQAFHNNSPLPLTTRFFPFGAEPQRFDIFSLAAPEALSKKGAQVAIKVRLSDASIGSLSVVQAIDGPRRAYSIGLNGQLQLVDFSAIRPEWIDLGAPGPDNQAPGAAAESSDRLTLDSGFRPQAVQYLLANGRLYDSVTVRDRRGRLWHYTAVWSNVPLTFETGYWAEFNAPDNGLTDHIALYRSTTLGNREIAVIGMTGGALQYVRGHGGLVSGRRVEWHDVTAAGAAPQLNDQSVLIEVLTEDWPEPSTANPFEVFALDDGGRPWLGSLNFDYTQDPFPEVEVAWQPLFDPAVADPVAFNPLVRPAAHRSANGVVSIYGASAGNNGMSLRIVQDDAGVRATLDVADIQFTEQAQIQIDPNGFGDHGARIVFIATRNGTESVIQMRDVELHQATTLPADVSNPASVASFMVDDVPALLIAGDAENLYAQRLPDPVTVVNYRDSLVLPDAQVVDGYMQAPGQAEPEDVIDLPDANQAVINQGNRSVFPFPANEFAVGQWQILRIADDGRLERDAAFPGNQVRVLNGNPVLDDILVVNGRRYRVMTVPVDVDPDPVVEDIRIELNSLDGLGNGNHNFDVVVANGNLDVDALHENTLLEIVDASIAAGDPNRLRFTQQPAADPVEQQVEVPHGTIGATLWVLVAAAWNQVPVAGELVELFTANTNEQLVVSYPRNFQNPELAWEYFDGEGWRRFENDFIDQTENFSRTGDLLFSVPASLSAVEVAGQEDFFIRARLVGGDYGRPVYKVESTVSGGVTTQSVTVDTSGLQPPEIQSVSARFKLDNELEPEAVLVSNNLTVRNQTQAAISDRAVFDLFRGARGLDDERSEGSGRSLYFGFTEPFGPGPLSLFVDAQDAIGDGETIAEALTDEGWRPVSIDDHTHGLRRRGFARLSVDAVPVQTRRFGKDRYWLRLRLVSATNPWRPTLLSASINAVTAVQSRTTAQEILGSSSGEPSQTFTLSNPPVLPDSLELRVRENLTEEEREALLEAFGSDAVVRYEDIDLAGDWVLWQRVDSFVPFSAEDRVYRLNASIGEVAFGDSTRVPTAGRDNLRAVKYSSGGGIAGNVDAYAVKNLKSAVRGVEKVANPVAATGGTDSPEVTEQLSGSPALVRRAGRALMPVDIEALVVASSPDRLQARCGMPTRPAQPIRVAVLQRGSDPCPQLSLADRQGIKSLILNGGWGALHGEAVVVEDPLYVAVRIKATLIADAVENGPALRSAAIAALKDLLNPVGDGPDGDGWSFGRPLWRSDILRSLSRLAYLDAIAKLDIDWPPAATEINMPTTGIICASADDIDIDVSLRRSICVEESGA